jgi:hypothetical protein
VALCRLINALAMESAMCIYRFDHHLMNAHELFAKPTAMQKKQTTTALRVFLLTMASSLMAQLILSNQNQTGAPIR